MSRGDLRCSMMVNHMSDIDNYFLKHNVILSATPLLAMN